jgi:hypothetical protein
MRDVPTSVYSVRDIRKAGWPTGGDAYGHGVPIVVVGIAPHQGDGNAGHRAKWDRLVNNKYRRVRDA